MKATRRALLLTPAALAAAPLAASPQQPASAPQQTSSPQPASAPAIVDPAAQARAVVQANLTAIAKVKLPQSLEPAFSFKP